METDAIPKCVGADHIKMKRMIQSTNKKFYLCIARFGELKSDPTTLVDSEGEALSLNNVDKALQSVGITLQNAQGEFRDFDDVILELAEHWSELSTNEQRYDKLDI